MESRTWHYLVNDYDLCTVTRNSSHENLLSRGLLKFVSENQFEFDGFFGCTHRCFSTLPLLRSKWVEGLPIESAAYNKILHNYTTVQVTVNFEKASGLSCQGVSTLDDTFVGQFGYGYNNLIKPYEANSLQPSEGLKYIESHVAKDYWHTKNPQLVQIAKHAHEKHAEDHVELHYVDDNVKLCEEALSVESCSEWPENVELKVYNHVAEHDEAEVYPLKMHGLFSMANRPVPTLSTMECNGGRRMVLGS